MSEFFKVSQSKVKLWRKCHYAYHLKYVEMLRAKRVRRPFQFGKIVHSMLEAHANGDDPFECLEQIELNKAKLFSAEREMYGEIIKDITTIMQGYFEYHEEDEYKHLKLKMEITEGKKTKLVTKYAEFPFEVLVDKKYGIVIKGILDGAVQTPNQLRWLLEHKTFTNMPAADDLWRNIQSSIYLKVIDMLGWWGGGFDGTCWDYVRSKPPSQPKMTKSGALSEAKISTLPIVVRKFLKANDLKARDYKKLVSTAEGAQGDYYKRIFTPVTRSVVNGLFDGFIDTAREMSEYHGKKKEKNIDRHCGFCDYEPICRAELLGMDVDYVKEREFITDEEFAKQEEADRSSE